MGKQPFHIIATPIASTTRLQLLKEGNDFLLCKVLDLPKMPVDNGHSYGMVLHNQKWMGEGLGHVFFLHAWHTPSRFLFASTSTIHFLITS
jgi:hypothetical protein